MGYHHHRALAPSNLPVCFLFLKKNTYLSSIRSFGIMRFFQIHPIIFIKKENDCGQNTHLFPRTAGYLMQTVCVNESKMVLNANE